MSAINSGGAAAAAAAAASNDPVQEVVNNKDLMAIVRRNLNPIQCSALTQTCKGQVGIAKALESEELAVIGRALEIEWPESAGASAPEHSYEQLVKNKYHEVLSVMQLCFKDEYAPSGGSVVDPATASTEDLYAAYKRVYDESLLKLGEEIRGITFSTADEVRAWLNDPANLPKIQAFTSLDLQNKDMRVLPNEIGLFTKLIKLDVEKNKFTNLPEGLRKLTMLDCLQLMENQLATLPEWIGELKELRTLQVSGNQLMSLPEGLRKLTKLGCLQLMKNQLTTLPEWIGELKKLRTLQVSDNQLMSLPINLVEMTSLKELFVKNNKLTSLPVELGQMSCLKSLDVCDNPIEVVPESLAYLQIPSS